MVYLLILLLPALAASPVVTEEGVLAARSFEDDFRSYMDYPAMTDYLERIVGNHSGIARLSSIGDTYEGREIWCVKVSDSVDEEDDGGADPEPNVLLVGAHHGNEWISYEVPLFVLAFLLENYGGSDANGSMATNIVDGRETYVVPMLNEDGTQYSFDRGSGFRKNREPNYATDFSPTGNGGLDLYPTSYGTDINRNYGWMWHLAQGSNALDQAGSSYRGAPDNNDDDGDARLPIDWRPGYTDLGPEDGVDEDPWDGVDNDGDGEVDEDPAGGFTTAEAAALRDLGDQVRFDALITYHSFSELVLWPWGYTDDPSPDDDLFQTLGVRIAELNGYTPMQGYDLYMTSGEMTDWYYAVYGTLAYTFEIGRSYAPPEEEILQHCALNLEASLYLCHASKNPYESYIEFDPNSSAVENGSDSMTVSISFTDTGYPVELDRQSFEVVFRDRSGKDRTVPLVEGDDGAWKAEIPRRGVGGRVEYYFRLVDTAGGEVTYPTYAPQMRLTAEAGGGSGMFPAGITLSIVIIAVAALLIGCGCLFYMRSRARRRKV